MTLFIVTEVNEKKRKVKLDSVDHVALDEAEQRLIWVYPKATLVTDKPGQLYSVQVTHVGSAQQV